MMSGPLPSWSLSKFLSPPGLPVKSESPVTLCVKAASSPQEDDAAREDAGNEGVTVPSEIHDDTRESV